MRNWIQTLVCIFLAITCCNAVCETENGESVLVLDLSESRGSQINQTTTPQALPINGDINDIRLIIQSASPDYFRLEGKRLVLKKPVDRDGLQFATIRLQILCSALTGSVQRSIAVVVRLVDINDNAPLFTSPTYSTRVKELTPIGSTIFWTLSATDRDAGPNALVEYFTVPGDGSATDGYGQFEIALPHQGLVTVQRTLDYEKTSVYYLKIKAIDKAVNVRERLSSTTTLTIWVEDEDDLEPTFIYQGCTMVDDACVNVEYKTTITSGAMEGLLLLQPEKIRAKDRDSLNSPIQYSFINGTPLDFHDYLEIDKKSRAVKQIKPIERSTIKKLELIVKAEEQTERRRFVTAKLTVNIKAIDSKPPVIKPTAVEGYVDENAPIGTTVFTSKSGSEPLHLQVDDPDIDSEDPSVHYAFELTTNAFKVTKEGYLVVNEAGIDRDPPHPSKYSFQVIAKQMNSSSSNAASAPISISVYVNDVNDNSPRLPSYTPVRIEAGDGGRPVMQIQARDNDDGDFAKISYSVYHVSNNGRATFRIHPDSGLVEVVTKVSAGEQYSITVQATDTGGRFSQTILDIIVVPGPNKGGPVFTRESFEIQVSEGTSVNSTVIALMAEDPEKDAITYYLVKGNINEDFGIESKTGKLFVAKPLNREEIESYQLVVKALDPSGLSSTVVVAITITDINDQNPTFQNEKYVFNVDEGVINAVVGQVQATDGDIGKNGEVEYSISDEKEFSINKITGEIRTQRVLDFESQKIHHLVVTAQDQAPDSRIATASVIVNVNDLQDEYPIFEKETYEGSVPENKPQWEILAVKAIDPDTVSKVTYTIREGNMQLFAIDATSGMIRTREGLDYEKQTSYTLVVGTVENPTLDRLATCLVHINIEDKNDVSPIITSVPLPIRLQDGVPLGTVVTTVVASDGDGTPPGNQIRYEISGIQPKAAYYFLVDGSSGVISVKDDLRKEPESEYRIEVIARDLGEPSLTATATVTVYVEHLVTVAPDSSLGFADNHYTVEVEENALANTLVKTLTVINKPRGNFPIGCEISSGNEDGFFYVAENEARDCELRIKSHGLDYESQTRHVLIIQLSTVGGLIGSSRLTTQVAVNVVDMNDNAPEFIVPRRYSQITNHRYLAALPEDSSAGTNFLQIAATDRDSGANGKLTYEIVPESNKQGFFTIDPITGYMSNSRTFEYVMPEDLPLTVQVTAIDNPMAGSSMKKNTDVLVNIINDRNRFILPLKGALPEKILNMKDMFLSILHQHTGMIVDIEKVQALRVLDNNTIESDTTGSDVWFYVVDPATLRMLPRDDPRLQSMLLEDDGPTKMLVDLSQMLNAHVERVREPYVITQATPSVASDIIRPIKLAADVSNLGASLIALAGIILLLGVVGIIYHCFTYSRYVSYRERVKRMCVAPRYDPMVPSEPSNLKLYETQVLQMSVPIDEDGSFTDVHLGGEELSRRRDGYSYGMPQGDFSELYRDLSVSPGNSSSLRQASTARVGSSLSGTKDDSHVKNPLFDDFGEEGDSIETYRQRALRPGEDTTVL